MSIITFGNTVQQRTTAVQNKAPTLTEELIDEQIQARLELAWRNQQDRNWQGAMEIYLDLLKSSTLAESVIEKHLLMQNQCHRNLGEVFEQLGAFEHAKHHYTQSLKLNAENSVAWTRLGFINYEHLRDLELAKKCFQAATKTMPTLDKIGPRICPVLVKLAEIAFLEAEFRESERILDAILTRQVSDKQTQLFVYLMKHYFSSLAGNSCYDSPWLQKALQIDPNAKVSALALFQKVRARSCKATLMLDKQGNFTNIDFDDREKVRLAATQVSDFPAFLQSLLRSIVELSDPDKFKKGEFVYDTQEYIALLEGNLSLFEANWHQACHQRLESGESLPMQGVSTQPAEKKVEKNQKILRKKPDNLEQMLRMIKLTRFQPYREHLYRSLPNDDAMSAKEIQAFIGLMSQGTPTQMAQQAQSSSAQQTSVDHSVMARFLQVLRRIDSQNCCLYARNLLKLMVELNLVNQENAALVFKLFLLKNTQDSLGLLSANLLLTVFELCLFSKPVIKETKPGPIIHLRSQFYEHCSANSHRILEQLTDKVQKFRFLHAMMYTAFEIKQDMQRSVQYYQRLDLSILDQNEIPLPWISDSYRISLAQVTQFGSQKIKEAQLVNRQNQALREMKQLEYESMKTAQYQRQVCTPEIVYFYLERFYQHLKQLLQTSEQTSNVLLNDDRLKEIWDQQLMFCVTRVQPLSDFYKVVHHLFCILSAFKSLAYRGFCQTTIYESIVLRRIDFEPLVQEIGERTKLLTTKLANADFNALSLLSKQCLAENGLLIDLINKVHIHLTRMLTPEFVLFNVRQGGSSCNLQDPGQPFLSAFFRCLFQLELLRGFDANSFQGLTLLLRSLDGVAQDMSELMMRAYSKCFQHSLAPLLRLWTCGCQEKDLQTLLEKSLQYLFKFQVDCSSVGEADVDDESMEEEMTELSLFDGMQHSKQEKPKFALPTPQQIFSQVTSTNVKETTDMVVVSDIVIFADQMAGNRLLGSFGANLTVKDVQNCSKLLEAVVKILQTDKLFKDVQTTSANDNYKFAQNPFSLQRASEQASAMQTVVKFVFNIYGCLTLQQHPCLVVMSPARRWQLIDKLIIMKDQQKIRNLSRMSVCQDKITIDAALTCSFIDMQMYMQAASTKLNENHKQSPAGVKDHKVTAMNAAIYVLVQSYERDDLASSLQALHQILNIVYCQIVFKRKKNDKFQDLVYICFYFSKVCELVECLLVAPQQKRDPRIQANTSQAELFLQAKLIIQKTIQEIQKSYESAKKSLLCNVTDAIQNLLVKSLDIEKHQRVVPQALLNPDYPQVQVQMQSFISDDVGVKELQQARKAFDFATASKDNLIALESAYDLIEKQLRLLIMFKYSQQQQHGTCVTDLCEQVTRGFLNDMESFAGRFSPELKQQECQDDDDDVLYDQRASHLVRGKLQVPAIQSADTSVDGFIHRLYKVGDTIVTKLQAPGASLAYQWLLVRFKYMLQKSLLDEVTQGLPKEKYRLLLDSADGLCKDILDLEENLSAKLESLGNGHPSFCIQQMQVVYSSVNERPQKSLFAMYYSLSIHKSMAETRKVVKQQLVCLWEHTCEYEPIFSLFRKVQDTYRKATERHLDQLEILNASKDALIRTVQINTYSLYQTYLRLRGQMQDFDSGKAVKKGYTECRQLLKELRAKYELTPQNHPAILRDAFDLFNETHSSRAFLKKSGLVSESQKHQARCALLQVCALCGPDETTEPGLGKFIDLGQSSEYSFEALQVCIKWYVTFLEQQKKTKKDQDLAKKLQQTIDEIRAELTFAMQELPFGSIQTAVRRQEVSASKVFANTTQQPQPLTKKQ